MQPTQQQKDTIYKVIDRIAPKYTFAFYEIDDIKQESYIICLEALENYDESRPLENFISKHLSNRLKTLIRDKYSRNDVISDSHASLNQVKKNLMNLQSFGNFAGTYEEDLFDKLSTAEALDKVMEFLSPSMRNDFYRIANGVSVQSAKKTALFAKVKEILGEDW
jgi:DNA-directed RNA polymerase specialized sigma subunit